MTERKSKRDREGEFSDWRMCCTDSRGHAPFSGVLVCTCQNTHIRPSTHVATPTNAQQTWPTGVRLLSLHAQPACLESRRRDLLIFFFFFCIREGEAGEAFPAERWKKERSKDVSREAFLYCLGLHACVSSSMISVELLDFLLSSVSVF